MAAWRYKIELNPLIQTLSEQYDLTNHEEPCPDEVREQLALEVEKAWPLNMYGKKLRKAKSIAELNRILNNVFDRADLEMVWCGF